MNAGLQMLMRSSRFCFSSTRRRSTSWMIPAVPGQSATGHVAAALQTSFPQTSLAPRATSNWSGKTGKEQAKHFIIYAEAEPLNPQTKKELFDGELNVFGIFSVLEKKLNV